jgi:hypothetical protein
MLYISIGNKIIKFVFFGYQDNQNNQKKAASASFRDANRRTIRIGSPAHPANIKRGVKISNPSFLVLNIG